jgi:N-acetylmuramoyl-L-alanine amidase-like protein
MTLYKQLANVARRTGYPVVEVPGWETRTRPQAMSDIRTITCHHTANGGAPGDYPSYNTVLRGRLNSDPAKNLPGPLAQYGIGRSGTIYVFAAGSANHAGESRSVNYEKTHAIGIEAEAEGTDHAKGDWPEVQMDAYARLCRQLMREFGLSINDVKGHKETCAPVGRKSDPSFSMDKFRDRVRSVGTSAVDIELGDDDMDPQAAADAFWNSDRIPVNDLDTGKPADPANPTWQADSVLGTIFSTVRRLREDHTASVQQVAKVKTQSDRIEAEQKRQAEVLDKILTALTPPPPEA